MHHEICISNLDLLGQLRTETNKVLEVARGGKLIGSSLDAKVYLHASDASLAPRLREMCSTNNDADTLHRIFITSQVCWTLSFCFTLPTYMLHSSTIKVRDALLLFTVN